MSRFDLRKREKVRMASVAAVSSLAVLAVLAASPGEASAYFTAYDTARWEQGLALGSQTEITEEYKDGVKIVTIQNTGETECFVRVKIFHGSQVGLTIAGDGDGWNQGADGYWYYQGILSPGTGENSKTKPLRITVDLSKAPVGGGDGDAPTYDQNVVVIEECAQVFYQDKADGTQEPYAVWNLSISATGEGAGV